MDEEKTKTKLDIIQETVGKLLMWAESPMSAAVVKQNNTSSFPLYTDFQICYNFVRRDIRDYEREIEYGDH